MIDLPGDCEFMFISRVSSCLPDGPYVLHTPSSNIFAISKLFQDKYKAFIGGGLKSNETSDAFEWLYMEVLNLYKVPCLEFLTENPGANSGSITTIL